MDIQNKSIEQLIENSMPFLIKTVSNITNRYVQCENDDEFSIALIAFNEAYQRYDASKGDFYTFAKLVIESRLKTYLSKSNKYARDASLEYLEEQGLQFQDELFDENNSELNEEIALYQQELSIFGLSFDDLVDVSPKHYDTRNKAFIIGQTIAKETAIVEETYAKKKLPVTHVSRFMNVSEKIIKHSKQFILATMIVFVKPYSNIQSWLKKARCANNV